MRRAFPGSRDQGGIKAIALLRALRAVPSGSARELAQATGVPRGTVQRLLSTLAGTQMLPRIRTTSAIGSVP